MRYHKNRKKQHKAQEVPLLQVVKVRAKEAKVALAQALSHSKKMQVGTILAKEAQVVMLQLRVVTLAKPINRSNLMPAVCLLVLKI